MSISGASASSSAYMAYSSMSLHAPGEADTLHSAQSVESTPRTSTSSNAKTQSDKKEVAKLSEEEIAQVRQLQARDRVVRQHELAHMSAAGGLSTSGPSFTYQRGPDGVNYAVGGEVSINVSPGRTPAETLDKAKTIERAALAPKDPSGADRAVAAQARTLALTAQQEIAQETAKNGEENSKEDTTVKADGQVDNTSQNDTAQNKRTDRVEQTYQTASTASNPVTLISEYT